MGHRTVIRVMGHPVIIRVTASHRARPSHRGTSLHIPKCAIVTEFVTICFRVPQVKPLVALPPQKT